MAMLTLVADVGGTQSRLGFADNGILNQSSVRNFVNANFSSFYEVIQTYLADTPYTQIERCVIAIAGPISSGTGTLTNLDWNISVDGLQQSSQCDCAILINDLTSLGYGLPMLPAGGIQYITGPRKSTPNNGQFLVVGLGTGFNVCPVLNDQNAHPTCLQVELGHTLLPHNIKSALRQQHDASAFNTVEDVFSGKGLSNLYKAISGTDAKNGALIVQDHLSGTDHAASQTLVAFSELLGLFTREMIMQYLPTAGVYFAGSVSRGIFGSGVTDVFEKSVFGQDHFLDDISQIPMALITDDAAGLLGCGQRSLWK